ncbi:hypothetical protein [Candidatus Pristimantibacillus sp. PTI5]|uniref:hypothetical protein n=1 Tax=Candidatus Pristimantibacillus sp. PTI5 TaxID=3400422 RepID=UPI003B010804
MSSFIGVLAIAFCAAWWELPKLIEKKRKKEIFVFMALLLLGAGLYGAMTLNAKLPNPFLLLKAVFGRFS